MNVMCCICGVRLIDVSIVVVDVLEEFEVFVVDKFVLVGCWMCKYCYFV